MVRFGEGFMRRSVVEGSRPLALIPYVCTLGVMADQRDERVRNLKQENGLYHYIIEETGA